MNQQHLHLFLKKLANSEHTTEEYAVFLHWVENCSREEYQQMLAYWAGLIESHEVSEPLNLNLVDSIEKGLDQIDHKETDEHTGRGKVSILWRRIAAAASILIAFSAAAYFLQHKEPIQFKIAQTPIPDIAPGGNKAILTLSDGRQIVLTNALNGKIAREGNTIIHKTADGQIVYHVASANSNSKQVPYNTITTPKGGLYEITLPDGTKVFLNSVSSLRYPVAFNGKNRTVELTGEAYFEVVHNSAAPFRVNAGGQMVEDIGTHFNINAYADEPVVKTTLLEGSVKVAIHNQQVILKPGQQSQIKISLMNQSINLVENADTEEAVAWKDGLFEFKKATVQQVMSAAARWYDLKVTYEDKVSDIKITGKISRDVNFSGLINLLEFEGVKFDIQGKNVIIKN